MSTLISDLLTFSRVIRRSDPLVPVDLNAVSRGVLSDLEVRIEKSGASVEQIRRLRDGQFDRGTIEKIAPVLRLSSNALSDIARNKWRPNEAGFLGLAQIRPGARAPRDPDLNRH